jgi:hypothetical protein
MSLYYLEERLKGSWLRLHCTSELFPNWLELHKGAQSPVIIHPHPRHSTIMILRIVKSAAIAGIWWHLLPWFVEQLPDIVLEHWKSSRKQWAILEALSLWLQTWFFITTVTNTWKFGERQENGERFINIYNKKLIKYSGIPLLLILLLSELASPLSLDDDQRTLKRRIAAFVLFAVASTLLESRSEKDKKTVYGLQHGRLHLDAHVPMWMNMGYWKVSLAFPTPQRAS